MESSEPPKAEKKRSDVLSYVANLNKGKAPAPADPHGKKAANYRRGPSSKLNVRLGSLFRPQ
jgi:hypothetical protein